MKLTLFFILTAFTGNVSLASELSVQPETTKESINCFYEAAVDFDGANSEVKKNKTVAKRTSWADPENENVTYHKTTGSNYEMQDRKLVLVSTYEAMRETETVAMSNTVREFSEITSTSTLATEGMTYENGQSTMTSSRKIVTEYSVDELGQKKILRQWNNDFLTEVNSTDFEMITIDGVKYTSSFTDKPEEFIVSTSTYRILWSKSICEITPM